MELKEDHRLLIQKELTIFTKIPTKKKGFLLIANKTYEKEQYQLTLKILKRLKFRDEKTQLHKNALQLKIKTQLNGKIDRGIDR